jgi:hypothetical protein
MSARPMVPFLMSRDSTVPSLICAPVMSACTLPLAAVVMPSVTASTATKISPFFIFSFRSCHLSMVRNSIKDLSAASCN